jgi:hypothetical protein
MAAAAFPGRCATPTWLVRFVEGVYHFKGIDPRREAMMRADAWRVARPANGGPE